MMPQNVYRAPLLDRQDVLSTSRVYIWDHREATAAETFCALGSAKREAAVLR